MTLRFSVLLFLFLVLSGGTYLAVSSAVSAKEYDSIVINISGRQRMLTQKYAREINQVLVGLAVSDWDMAAEMREAASRTAGRYEATLAALFEGGEVDAGRGVRIWIPPVQGIEVGEHLRNAKDEWEGLREAASQAMRSERQSLVGGASVRNIQVRTASAVTAMDYVVFHLQERSETRLRRVESVMICACLLNAPLFLGTVVFVRRKIVAPLDRSMTALENEIGERRRREKELRHAKVAAEAADRAKSEFLANMSHEIRTPMTAILGFTDAIAENVVKPENVAAIATVRRNGEYLLGLISDILDLSKIEAGKTTVERRNCEPCRVLAEVTSLMRVRADAKGLAFNIEYIGAIPETISSDSTRLRQILINLIGNAIKFTETGTVRLLTRFVDGDEPCLLLDVTDTGCGMSEEQQGKLFQPFMQADNSTTRKFGGTGLGLTISKRFAELLGGDITVAETTLGVGSTLRATVSTGPLDGVAMLDDPMSATKLAQTAGADAQVIRFDLQGCRILLAEDGPDNRLLISVVLKKAGAETTIVENGKLALVAALASRDGGNAFDVILMDMQMPVMDGYEATIQLRRKGYTAPIIALTAHAMAGDRRKCLDAGCNDYATKPVDRRKLVATIQAWREKRTALGEERATETAAREKADMVS